MIQQQFQQVGNRVFLWLAVICLAWWQMQVFHEIGHILGATLSGGTVVAVDLHPLHISHTMVSPNPHPKIVIWAGPITGVIGPLLLWLMSNIFWKRRAYLFRFFAGYCLIANGAYLGSAAINAVGDAKDLIRNDVPVFFLIVFVIATVPFGFMLWNGQGSHFGLGLNSVEPTQRESCTAMAMTILWIIFASCVFPFSKEFCNDGLFCSL